jgi:hypothetical protein
MKLLIREFVRTHGQTHVDERPVLHVWTTHARAPWFVEIDTRDCPVTVNLPTEDTYDALIFELLVDIVSDEDRVVRGHAGRGVARASQCTTGQLKLYNDTRTRETGWLQFSVDIPPRNGGFDPDCDSTITLCDRLTQRCSTWYANALPIDKEIERVHIPKLPGVFEHAPGFVFAAQKPVEPEDSALFERAVMIAARRRGDDAEKLAVQVISEINVPGDQPSTHVLRMAQYLAEGVQLVVNFISYLADPDIDDDKIETVDRFSADVRMTKAGDCEDLAREVAMLWALARDCLGSSTLIRAISLVARCYVACEHLGAVALRGSAFLDKYTTGGKMYAHAFSQIIPASWFDTALHNDDAFNRIKLASNMLVPWRSGLRTLTLDGVRLCDSDAFAPSFPYTQPHIEDDFARERIKCVERVGTRHYVFIASSYIFGALQTAAGCPVYEICYMQGNGRYGLTFEQSHETHHTVRIACTHDHDEATCESVASAFVRYLHPVLKWNTADAPSEDELVKGARSVFSQTGLAIVSEGAPPGGAAHAILGPKEYADTEYLTTLAQSIKKRYTHYAVYPERIAHDASGLSLFVWT